MGRSVRAAAILNFAALLAFTALGQFSFKIAADRLGVASLDAAWIRAFLHEPSVALILFANFGALVSYLTLVRNVAIGPAFAAAHLSIVVVVIVSVAYFHETLNWIQALGCVAIFMGVGILGHAELSAPKPKTIRDRTQLPR
jgi:drug/metabolite transporter (DMT)-like permease